MSSYTFTGRYADLSEGVFNILEEHFEFDEDSFEDFCVVNSFDIEEIETELEGFCEQHSSMPQNLWNYINEHADWNEIAEAVKAAFPTPPAALDFGELLRHSVLALDLVITYGEEGGVTRYNNRIESTVRRSDRDKIAKLVAMRLQAAREIDILPEEMD